MFRDSFSRQGTTSPLCGVHRAVRLKRCPAELSLAVHVGSHADLCISFLTSLLQLGEFRREEDLGKKISLTRWPKNVISGPFRVEREQKIVIGLFGLSCNIPLHHRDPSPYVFAPLFCISGMEMV